MNELRVIDEERILNWIDREIQSLNKLIKRRIRSSKRNKQRKYCLGNLHVLKLMKKIIERRVYTKKYFQEDQSDIIKEFLSDLDKILTTDDWSMVELAQTKTLYEKWEKRIKENEHEEPLWTLDKECPICGKDIEDPSEIKACETGRSYCSEICCMEDVNENAPKEGY